LRSTDVRLRREYGLCGGCFWSGAAPGTPTRLILLGVAGGPSPKKMYAAPSQVILVGDRAYVVDCGNGVARQLVLAGVSLTSVRHVFVTHHHSDHNADYGNLWFLAWAAGLQTPVDTWGPPPLAAMTRQFFELNAFDIQTRIADEGRVPLAPLIHAHDPPSAACLMTTASGDGRLAHHPPACSGVRTAGTADRSVVISGDRNPNRVIGCWRRGPMCFVHEALHRAVDRSRGARRQRVDAEEAPDRQPHVGRRTAPRAQAAGVTTPCSRRTGDDPSITEAMWADAARAHFRGRVIVGRDLLEI
jgi:ribonuclease BN (tRNA processing enzyme)